MNSVIPPSAICHPCIETPPDDRPVQADVLKERLIWRMEFETLDELGAQLAAYVDRYHHRPHSGLDYRTPKEVRQTWDDAQQQPLKLAA